MVRGRPLATALVAAAFIVPAGCGSDDSSKPVTFDTPAVKDPATAAALEQTFKRSQAKFLARDYAAVCAGFTTDYMKKAYQVPPDRCVDKLAFLRDQLPKSEIKLPIQHLRAKVDGDRGVLVV